MLKGKIITPLDAATSEDLKTKADLVNGKVPAEQLPSYVDDVAEYASLSDFPETGEEGKIYVALDSGFTYRWSGSEYIQIGGQDLSDYYTKSEADQLLDTKQPVGDYATNAALTEGLATKQPIGDYATNAALTEGLATKQDKGDYATNSALNEGLAAKQDKGDYATNTALEAGLATKQPVGDYATNAALTEGLATKQPVGDYATSSELTAGLATKQPVGDYATNSDLTSGLAAKQNILTTSAIPSGDNVTYIGFDANGNLKKDEFNPISSEEIIQILQNAGKEYIIGFSGAAQSNPALTRTDKAIGASFTTTDGVIEINGIDMSKVWGGYIGNDEEELVWDATNGKYLHNGVEYTGNVFSKINRFFTKASYVEVNGEQVLDGYQLCYANAAPDDTWQDWFLGKPYTKIGCYKARGGDDWTNGLQSKQGLMGYALSTNANKIATASALNTSTTATMHMKWYNQNSILQVLFMALFATRQTEDVFPHSSYRYEDNAKSTGYFDFMRIASTCATGYSLSGNMFLGIEDFIGYGQECLGGIKLSGTNVQTSLDYDTFDFNNTYTQADINITSISSSKYISTLQESSSVPGLLLPKKSQGTEKTYYCSLAYIGGVPIYQGASAPKTRYSVFYFEGSLPATYSGNILAARLCGEPL